LRFGSWDKIKYFLNMPYIILDTNIYRELGYEFYNKTDYKNLVRFSLASKNELVLCPIVEEEFISHFEEHLRKKFENYSNSIKSIAADENCQIEKTEFPDISKYFDKSLNEFKRKLLNDIKFKLKFSKIENIYIDSLDLTKFLLKHKTNNVQVRDYLIWESLLFFASQNLKEEKIKIGRTVTIIPKQNIYFITRDKGFLINEAYQEKLIKLKIDNIMILNSLAEYFHFIGFQIPFVTEKLLKDYFKSNLLLKYLNKDIKALASYIHPYTELDYKKIKIYSREIEKIEVLEFYSYTDPEDNNDKFIVHLKVFVNVIFDTNISIYIFKDILDYPMLKVDYLNTFDSSGKAQFQKPILFIFEGLLDKEYQKIKSIENFDFIPDYFFIS